jgi:uncharacterized protein YraI
MRMESLESRSLMAGDVMVALEGSFLRVQGDDLTNHIALAGTPDGDVIVYGQNGTLVNGLAQFRLVRPSINAVDIRMEKGDDIVNFHAMRIANDLFVEMGEGNDRVLAHAATPSTVGANMSVYGGLGNDTVQLNRITVGEDLKIEGGWGALQSRIVDSTLRKSLTVIADDLADSVIVHNTRVTLDTSIETKGGADHVELTDIAAFSLNVNTDANGIAGRDQVYLTRVSTREDIGVYTGAGDDYAQMIDVNSGKSIKVSMDVGNDRLYMVRVRAATDAVFEGGSGFDTVDYQSVFGGVKREFKEFERRIAR